MALRVLPSGWEGLGAGLAGMGEGIGAGLMKKAERESEAKEALKKYIREKTTQVEMKGYRSIDEMPEGGFKIPEGGFDTINLTDVGAFYRPKAGLTPSQKMSLERLAQSSAINAVGGSMMMGIGGKQQEYQQALDRFRKQYTDLVMGNSQPQNGVDGILNEDNWMNADWK